MVKTKEQKAEKKENSAMIKRTLKFIVQVAWKERPALFFVYGLLFVAQQLY